MDEIQLNLEANIKNANQVKDLVLDALVFESLITREQADQFCDTYQVIIIKNGWFQRWMKKYKKQEDNWSFKMVKF